MVDGAVRRAGWLVRLVVLVVLVTACERSSEPGADPPGRPTSTTAAGAAPAGLRVQEYPVPAGSRPHDVAPAAEGRSVWYTAQGSGELGLLDPATGESRLIPLGEGSAPHGVIVGPDGAPWITDGGLNAIVRVDPRTEKVDRYPLPPERGSANLNGCLRQRVTKGPRIAGGRRGDGVQAHRVRPATVACRRRTPPRRSRLGRSPVREGPPGRTTRRIRRRSASRMTRQSAGLDCCSCAREGAPDEC
jgi:hypothetical protein